MSELFLEIGCEEIPARMQAAGAASLQERLSEALQKVRLTFDSLEVQVTPRRLMAAVANLAERQPDMEELRKGPRVEQSFDAQGQPTKAAEGFAKSCGVEMSRLERVATPKGECLAFRDVQQGLPSGQVLPGVVEAVVNGFPWPKSMRWGSGEMRFVRPVFSLVVLLDGKSLPVTLDGIVSGKTVQGHHILSPGPFKVKGLADYRKVLQANKVMLDREERKAAIVKGARRLTADLGGEAVLDEGLLEENAGLVEWPVPMLGRFDASYLTVPPEVLMTAMKNHQKYFPVRKADGSLLPCFVVVSNVEVDNPAVLVRGYERVLKARLEDAAFYWQEDRKIPLPQRVPALEKVVYQARLGTLGQKRRRLEDLAAFLAQRVAPAQVEMVRQAAHLAKADLVTGLVGEFPELQGLMGGYYAQAAGLSDTVARAIREHYQPQGAGDDLPASEGGQLLALADKIDTLIGCFGIGLTPTGTKDPFGLRRAALGVLRIILGASLRLPLKPVLEAAWEGYARFGEPLEQAGPATTTAVLEFLFGRLKFHLKSDGLDYDLIDAVQALGLDDLGDAVSRIRALADFKQLDSYMALVAANKRIANILDKAPLNDLGAVQTALLKEPAEKALHGDVDYYSRQAQVQVGKGAYQPALEALAQLREPIDAFFQDVLVMAEDAAVRTNRLRLLLQVREAFRKVAEVSLLQLPEE
ncbi:MAG: glycine--tRNA ligase subunit beta [Magnetococcales bacterium]|nr:glycine--tRNA ligase subunit beta [Magnetococcales bacterium]